MNNSIKILSDLPALVVADIKSHLGAYDRAFITKNADGQYKHTAALALKTGKQLTQTGLTLNLIT